MGKRVISLLAALVLVIGMMPANVIPAFAAEEVSQGTTGTLDMGGRIESFETTNKTVNGTTSCEYADGAFTVKLDSAATASGTAMRHDLVTRSQDALKITEGIGVLAFDMNVQSMPAYPEAAITSTSYILIPGISMAVDFDCANNVGYIFGITNLENKGLTMVIQQWSGDGTTFNEPIVLQLGKEQGVKFHIQMEYSLADGNLKVYCDRTKLYDDAVKAKISQYTTKNDSQFNAWARVTNQYRQKGDVEVTLSEIKTGTLTVAEEVPELKFSHAAPVLANDLAMEFQADASLFGEELYTDPTATFTFNGQTVTKPVTLDSTTGKYVCLFTGIAPHQMGDPITYTLRATYNGETVTTEEKTYSMLQYCTSALANAENTELLKTLIVDTLNYGAAAQIHEDYNTDSLVNASLTDDQKALATDVRDYNKVTSTGEGNASQSAVWKTATVILNNSITTEFSFQSSLTGLTVKVNGSEDHVTVVESSDGMYTVYYEGLNAAQLSDSITAVVYQGDTAVSTTLTYSVESCAYYQVNDNLDATDALKSLVKAMMAYGDAAKAYVPAE